MTMSNSFLLMIGILTYNMTMYSSKQINLSYLTKGNNYRIMNNIQVIDFIVIIITKGNDFCCGNINQRAVTIMILNDIQFIDLCIVNMQY